jgi:MFS transporter, putative metabolite transport protein
VVPEFAIDTFAPDLLRALGSPNPTLGTAILSLFFLAGVVPAVLSVERIGRRPLLILPFLIQAAVLAALAFLPAGATTVIAICFIVFAVFNAGSSVLQWVYPSELFPTEVRATALGFATSVSRIGAAVGTFLFPIGLHYWGISTLLLLVAGVCLIGWVASLAWAPETRGMTLMQASAARHETVG